MTVTYTSEVTTSRGISIFLVLLARWRGSIYKIVWVDLLLFLGLYYILYATYHLLDDEAVSKRNFEYVVTYCDKYGSLIPLSFVLGFYVNLVMDRWWKQYCSIPFPDNLAILVGASIKGQDERARVVRRTIMRYVCVTFTITLTMCSPKVKKRFPTLQHFVEAGLLTTDEMKIMEDLDNEFPSYSKYWLPLAWASNIITRGRHEGLIRDDVSVKTILEEINLFRSKCGAMLDYDWISIPLVYTQVVTLAVYSYFIVTAIGKQPLKDGHDLYFPFLPVLEFFFYMGWMKVAETLINPYGEDDDDFEVVWMIDRHVQVCYLLVDKIHQEHPKLMRDPHWVETAPNGLPYTLASRNFMQEYPFPSTMNVNVKKSDQDIVVPDDVSQIDGNTRRRRSGAYLWRIYGKHFYKNAKSGNVPLQKVSMTSHQTQFDDTNTYDDSLLKPVNRTKTVFSEDFERLRQERKEARAKKLQKIIELHKEDNSKKLERIIEDFVQ